MPKAVEAIYEDGVLKPLKKLDIEEHQRVHVIITIPKIETSKGLPKPIQHMIDILHGPLPIRAVEDMGKDSEIDAD